MPAVWHVTNGNDSGTGSLRQAYADAQAAGNQQQIVIDATVGAIVLDSPLVGNSVNLTILEIDGPDGAPVQITPDGPGLFHTFRFIDHVGNNGLQIILKNITFDEFGAPKVDVPPGGDSGDGGTIRTNAPLTLNDCTFLDSVAGGSGGAIYTNTTLTATDCFFGTATNGGGNMADGDGGAIADSLANGTSYNLTLTGCQFFGNEAVHGNGGAVYFYTDSGTLTIRDSDANSALFTGNSAPDGKGGAVYQYGGYIDAVSAAAVSFSTNVDSGFGGPGNENGNSMYLKNLHGAVIDMASTDGANAWYLVSDFPPTAPPSPTVHSGRMGGGLVTNWDEGWFY